MFKLFAVITLATGVWIGVKADRFLMEDRCLDAGGRVNAKSLCIGAVVQ